MHNDHSLKRPSDAESDHRPPFAEKIVPVFDPGIVGHYQTEGDVDHRHLDAEFKPKRRADVLRYSPFTLRCLDDLEGLRLALKVGRLVVAGEGPPIGVSRGLDLSRRRYRATRGDYHAAITGEHRVGVDGKDRPVNEVRREDLVVVFAGVEDRADVGERRDRQYADDRNAVLEVVNELSVAADHLE